VVNSVKKNFLSPSLITTQYLWSYRAAVCNKSQKIGAWGPSSWHRGCSWTQETRISPYAEFGCLL